jgi:uncharacterized protein YjiS (DUF1127 family)
MEETMSSRSLTSPVHLGHTGPVIHWRLRRVLELLFLWDERHRARSVLAAMDDRMLRDVGLDRTAALTEAAKPFWRP